MAHQIQNLRTHPCVAEAVEAGTLLVEGWVYDIGEGSFERVDSVGAVGEVEVS